MPRALRPLVAADVEALRALYDRQVAPAPGWSAAEAPGKWLAVAQGDRSCVVVEDGRVVGGVGTVLAPPWMYVFPLVADAPAVAAELLEVALGHAAPGITTARLGVRAGEEAKRAAALARGFTPSIDFVDLRHELGDLRPGPRPAGRRVAAAALDRRAVHALHDRVFAEIPNTAPLDDADFADMLDGPMAWPAATAAWVGDDGELRGFVIGQRGADERGRFGVVEAVGVAAAGRGAGIARALVDDVLACARAEGLVEVRVLIAGTNLASLALHRAAGFVESGRRQMYDLALGG